MNQEKKVEEIDPELECQICFQLFYRPVSLFCGHTFCRECIQKSLESKPQCPLCRSPTFLLNNNLCENIAIKSLIEKKYPSEMFEKQNEEAKKQLNAINQRVIQKSEQNYKPKEFSHIFALQIDKFEIQFPGTIAEMYVKFQGPKQLFEQVCADGNFICFNNKQEMLGSEITLLVKCLEMSNNSNSKGFYKMKVEIQKRVKLSKVTSFQNENKELQQNFQLPEDFIFHACSGVEYDDEPDNEDFFQLKELLLSLQKFWLLKLNEYKSFWMMNKLKAKLPNDQTMYLLNGTEPELIKDFETISQLSLIFAGLLISHREEKQEMFVTNRLTERLIILNQIIDRLQDVNNLSQIYNIEIPGNSLNNVRNGIILLSLFILFLIANQFKLFDRFNKRHY